MLNTDQITRIITESCLFLDQDISSEVVRALNKNYRVYSTDELEEFKRDLSEAGYQAGLQLLEYRLHPEEIKRFFRQRNQAVLIFHRERNDVLPWLITGEGKKYEVVNFIESGLERKPFSLDQLNAEHEPDGQITLFSIMKLENLVSEHYTKDFEPTPVSRFFHLLQTEKKDILYILFYAFFIGMISLAIPLGIQTTVELISGGLFFSSVYILIAGVIIAVLMAGGMQVFQIMLVEFLQRRIFTRAAFEFAYRMPRLDTRSIERVYAPALANRFFDVLTLQKGLPKFLIEFSGAVLQILFGILLLSLYHPLFILFGFGLLSLLIALFYFTGPRALSTSIQESSYKYKLIHWLEDLARMHHTIKLSGSTTIPISKTDFFVNNYLKNRKSHFKILLFQFTYTVLFKALIIGGLLIIGTILVVQREITLGQFVASEVVIILILNSIEKIIMYMDVIYDLLTAVDKIGAVTDLPMERRGGLDMPNVTEPFALSFKNVKARSSDGNFTLQNISFDIKPGERICVAGPSGSGKTTLADLMSGLVSSYEGAILVNGFAIRDLDLTYYRDHLAANGPSDDLFEGTLIDNILVGNPKLKTLEAIEALDKAGLKELIASWPSGIDTPVTSEGKGFSSGISHRIMIARALVRKPLLMILHDHFSGLTRKEKMEIFGKIFNEKSTIVCFSNDPMVMGACEKVLLLESGRVKDFAPFRELMQKGFLNELTD